MLFSEAESLFQTSLPIAYSPRAHIGCPHLWSQQTFPDRGNYHGSPPERPFAGAEPGAERWHGGLTPEALMPRLRALSSQAGSGINAARCSRSSPRAVCTAPPGRLPHNCSVAESGIIRVLDVLDECPQFRQDLTPAGVV